MSVIAIGGSVLLQEDRTFRKELLGSYVQLVEDNSDSISAVVLGGGSIAREYIDVGEYSNLDDDALDRLGINITQANAKLFSELLSTESAFVDDMEELENLHDEGVIAVLGGTEPGQTTDAVATEVAEILGDNVLFCSNVDGLYDTRGGVGMDGAKLFDEVSTEELRQIVATQDSSPGRSVPVDRTAVNTIERAGITAFLFDGLEVGNAERVLGGERVGTEVYPSE